MKTLAIAVPALALLLTACGEEAVEPGDPKSIDEVVAEAENLAQPQPGLYRSTTELVSLDIPGAPAAMADQLRSMMGSQFSQSSESCITPEQAERGFEDQYRQIGEGMNGMSCEFEQFDVDGGDVDARLACSGPQNTTATLTMDGEVGETRQSVDMAMEMRQPQLPGGSMDLRLTVLTERIGDCN